MFVNGSLLGEPSLLNKLPEFTLVGGVDMTWVSHGRWRVLYSPDFEAAIKDAENHYACPDSDPYRFLLDITPYVHPGENTITLEHQKVLEKPSTMVIRNVFVEVGKSIAAPEGEIMPAPTGELRTYVADGPQTVAMEVGLSEDGAISVSASGRDFTVDTRTSLPDGAWHEPDAELAQRSVAQGETQTVAWDAGSCTIERAVSVRSDHVHVADTITNPGDTLVGVIIEHRANSTEAPPAAYIAGRKAHAAQLMTFNAANPAVFASFPEAGLGLVAEDDILRVHNKSFLQEDEFGIADTRLGLEAGASVTQEWSIYPTPGGDYWDFVNAVRRNWGSNFTIPGPFVYNSGIPRGVDAETTGQWGRDRAFKIICGGIAKYGEGEYAPGQYAHGTGINFAPGFVAAERDWISKMQKAAPEITPVCYFHAQCCTEPDAETKFADARLIDAQGEHIGYPYRYRLPLFVPTRENSYGKALWGYVDTILDEIGASGLYWDEMSHSVAWYAHDLPWDGYSVGINETTHAVTQKLTCVPLITQPLRQDIARHVRAKGKFLMANTQAPTRTMLDEKIVRFVETGTYSAMANTHLGCPLGLGNHHLDETAGDVAEMIRNMLRVGGTWYGHHYLYEPPEWDFGSVMFPITPEELHEGMVIGSERIHTAQSGRFGFPDGAQADVYVVGGDGMRALDADVTEVVEDGKYLYEIRMPGDQFAILVKQGEG